MSSFFDVFVSLNRSPILAMALPMTLGAASGLVTRTSVDHWYPKQLKPPGEPPRKAFPIVWSLLYAGMGLASSRLVNAWDRSPSFLTRDNAKSALMAYGLQLALNLAWTPLFFGLQKPVPALVDIVALTVTNYRLSALSFGVDKLAGYIYLAYSAWTTYATYLNAGIVYLNPSN